MCPNIGGFVPNSVDPGKTLHSATSDLGLYWLLRSLSVLDTCTDIFSLFDLEIYGRVNSFIVISSQPVFPGQAQSSKYMLWVLIRSALERHFKWVPMFSGRNKKYRWLSLSRLRLSQMTAYLKVKIWSLLKHENLTTGNKILWKRREIAPQEQFLFFSTIFSLYL